MILRLVDMALASCMHHPANICRKVRSKLYGIVGTKWRCWDDAEADIQDLQMGTIDKKRGDC